MYESALRAAIDLLGRILSDFHQQSHLWTVAVIVGCALEVISVVREFLEDRTDWLRGRWRGFAPLPDEPSTRWLAFDILGVVLVVAGIWGELYCDKEISTAEEYLGTVNGDLVLLLEQRAGDAANSALRAKTEADAVDARAGKLNGEFDAYENAMAESLFAWRISMSHEFQITGDRVLNPFTFENTLKGKPKGHVEVWASVDNREAHALSFDIWSALKRSGWDAGSTIHRLPPEHAALWNSLVVHCHPWQFSSHTLVKPRTSVEALLAALVWGVERPGPASGSWWEEPDANLAADHCVVEVHAQTTFERQFNEQYNSNPSAPPITPP